MIVQRSWYIATGGAARERAETGCGNARDDTERDHSGGGVEQDAKSCELGKLSIPWLLCGLSDSLTDCKGHEREKER